MTDNSIDWSTLGSSSGSGYWQDNQPYECVFLGPRTETSQAGKEYEALVFETIEGGDVIRVPAFLGPVRMFCRHHEIARGGKVVLMRETRSGGLPEWIAVDS
tara:strand:- start:197 stop:502 length:306 start_codon:yes stop_codon:yes gene_type:complete